MKHDADIALQGLREAASALSFSLDIGRDDYLKSVRKFKEKWFKESRTDRLKEYVDKAIKELREDLINMIEGGENG